MHCNSQHAFRTNLKAEPIVTLAADPHLGLAAFSVAWNAVFGSATPDAEPVKCDSVNSQCLSIAIGGGGEFV